mmetsp:Transcript_943/g.1878  ORF Transcript_943/g.1878 Transcript_943/m.1878 type:complete len:557 (-) Transcript_943:133-1803(-)
MPIKTENSPLLGLRFVGQSPESLETHCRHNHDVSCHSTLMRARSIFWTVFIVSTCLTSVYVLGTTFSQSSHYTQLSRFAGIEDLDYVDNSSDFAGGFVETVAQNIRRDQKKESTNKSPYSQVQTLSFQIYTGGAPAFIPDETTGKLKHNHECRGLNSYGLPEDSDSLQCYLGLEDSAKDVQHRLGIMTDAVNRAYDVSNKDPSVLKIFLAPEFFFRGKDGAFAFASEESEEANGACSDICHILKGLENIAAQKRFEHWLFLFGTVIGSEALPKEDTYDYQFYNFAPLFKGFDPAISKRVGKNFLVPKRYVSNIDFLTPLRHLTNRTIAMELLDDVDLSVERTLMNPHANNHKKYDNQMWAKYKDELTELGYNMIEYGWFYMDEIAFSVEICLDHLVHRALMTYNADIVTGSKTLVPSSSNDSVEWRGIPKSQAQISLVSSAGMDITVASLALANGGHIFLQDGMEGDVPAHSRFGEDECQPNEYEFLGGSQSVKRTAVISATDVTFEYEMSNNYDDHEIYPEDGGRHWKDVLKGVFSREAYKPKLTVYDLVNITLV